MLTPSFERRVPQGDDRERRVCTHCDFVDYQNPKIVVGAVVVAADGRFLLCRRGIEPRRGFWTVPAGFLELGETAEAGAIREAREEAECVIEIDGLLGAYSVARIGQVHLMYRARLIGQAYNAGPESLEVALFTQDEIPWQDIAFPTGLWALEDYIAWTKGASAPFANRTL